MEFTVSSVLVPKSSANVFGLHISLLALAGVDCISLRSLKTFFGLWSLGQWCRFDLFGWCYKRRLVLLGCCLFRSVRFCSYVSLSGPFS